MNEIGLVRRTTTHSDSQDVEQQRRFAISSFIRKGKSGFYLEHPREPHSGDYIEIEVGKRHAMGRGPLPTRQHARARGPRPNMDV